MSELKGFSPSGELSPIKKTQVRVERVDSLGVGLGEGTVDKVSVDVMSPSGRSRKMTLAEKRLYDDNPKKWREDLTRQIIQTHSKLKALGLPVVPTLRIDEDRPDSIYMTDLTRDGKADVYSVMDWAMINERRGKLSNTGKRVLISNAEQLSEQISDLYAQACAKSVRLTSTDIFFLVVDKDTEKARIILGDLSGVEFPEDQPYANAEENHHTLCLFIDYMNERLKLKNQLNKQSIETAHQAFFDAFEAKYDAEEGAD